MDRKKFFRHFHEDMKVKLRTELSLFRLFGLVEGKDTLRVTEKGMHPVSVMMREFFASLNTLREHCIEHQI